MARSKTQQAQNDNNGSFDLTINSLRKRGIELSSQQLSLCILYNRFNNIAYKVSNGLMSMSEATEAGDQAYNDYLAKTQKRSSVGF